MRVAAFALLIGVASPAFAADVIRPVAPAPVPVVIAPRPYDWSGHYLGLHAGYLWGHTAIHEDTMVAGGDVRGFVGGVLGGFNVLHNGHIMGLEGDFGWTSAKGEGAVVAREEY